jgi:predicted O-methyltransferase YrrM
MDCRGLYLAQSVAAAVDLGPHHHLLDIAGGSGVYACALAAHNPHLRATVLDKPPVDRIAAAAIARRGLTSRVSVHASDMLVDPLPSVADVHLFSNVLHDWDEPVVRQLLERSFAALPPGGLVIVHDAFLNAEKTGPLHVAEYSVLLMHACEGRCYSIAEMETFLTAAGFIGSAYVNGSAARGIMTARKP